MYDTARIDCPLCSTTMTGREQLRLHLQVDHRKSDVVDEYVDHLDRSPTVTP